MKSKSHLKNGEKKNLKAWGERKRKEKRECGVSENSLISKQNRFSPFQTQPLPLITLNATPSFSSLLPLSSRAPTFLFCTLAPFSLQVFSQLCNTAGFLELRLCFSSNEHSSSTVSSVFARRASCASLLLGFNSLGVWCLKRNDAGVLSILGLEFPSCRAGSQI